MASAPSARGKVWLVGAGPGDPDLITCRGVEVLAAADVVLYDALSHPELLAHCPQAQMVNVGKRYGERSPAQADITAQVVHFARQGKRVVRLKGGDPMLFARGAEEALALEEAGIEFEVVPGISSAIAASEFAGISLTHREVSSSVTFITGSDREGHEWSPDAWKKLATATDTICVYMGMRRLEAIAQAIVDGGRSENTPAAVVMWGARPEQRTVVGTLANIAERVRAGGLSNPAVIIVGEVVALRPQLNWYESKPLFGQRVLVARPAEQCAETVRSLRARGARAVVRPAIVLGPAPEPSELRDALGRLDGYDWVTFTSANGVRSFFATLRELGRDARALGAVQLAVIGEKTAAALETYGVRADLVAEEFVAESLADKLLALPQKPRRLLLARAAEAREVLPNRLRAAGVDVDVVAAYSTRSVRGDALQLLVRALESEVDVVLLTSSSMVTSVVEALGAGALGLLGRLRVVCIGPVTAATARQLGVRVDTVASVFTVEGALTELETQLLAERSRPSSVLE